MEYVGEELDALLYAYKWTQKFSHVRDENTKTTPAYEQIRRELAQKINDLHERFQIDKDHLSKVFSSVEHMTLPEKGDGMRYHTWDVLFGIQHWNKLLHVWQKLK